MNRIYRIVWNATINRWVVASEVAKGRKKQSAGEARPSGQAAVMFAATLMVAGAAWTPQPAHAFFTKCNLIWGACPKVVVPVSPAPAPAPDASYDWASSTHKYFRANDTGSAAEPLGGGSVAIGGNSRARDWYTLAAGNNAKGSGYSAVAVGGWSHAAGSSAVAVGNTASAKQEHAIAVGGYSRAESKDAVALGSHSSALAEGALSVGSGSSSNVAFGSALGTGARVVSGADGAVALGAYSVADRDNTVSVGDAKGDKRQVVNVGAGTEGFDAVNVNQLRGVTNALGGGANIDGNGNVVKPTYQVGGNTYNNVGDALAAVQGAGQDPLDVHYDDATRARVSLAGPAGTRLANVQAGVETGDAVNVGQLRGVTGALGGGAGVDGNGNVVKPSYTVGGNTFNNVGDALTALQGAVADPLDVHYDDASRARVTLGGNGGTRIANLQAGLDDADAVNVSQLRSAGFSLDGAGKVLNEAVTYQAGSIASGSPRVVLAPGSGNSQYYLDGDRAKGLLPKGTVLSNVADGVQDTDAANIGQVKIISQQTINDFRNRNLLLPEVINGVVPPIAAAEVVPETEVSTLAAAAAAAAAPSAGSDIDSMVQRRVKTLENGNWYLKVAGRSDGVGRTGPTDQAQNAGVPAAIAIGSDSATRAENGIAMGVQALVVEGARDAVALGAGSVANEANTVSVGSLGRPEDVIKSYDANSNPVTLTNVANTRRVVNMAAGQNDNDAVNVSQLKDVVGGLGGGAAVQPDGTVSRPTYEVDGNNYDNVGDALKAAAAASGDSALAVKYTDAGKTRVALEGAGGTTLANVKAAAADDQAVNLKQLKDAGLTVDNGGNVTNSFVSYDAADKGKITLAGAGGTTISNVKAGVADQDAVNVKQLKDSGIVGQDGNVQKAVLFNADGTDANANADGKKLANLAAGSRDADAVNLKQLKDAGLTVDGSGNVTNSFVSYDATDKGKVTLAGNGGTTIANVKAGVADQDAVNVKQLKDTGLVDGDGNVQKAVLFNADGTTANANAAGKQLANLAAGSRDTDAVNLKQLKDAGISVDPGTGQVTNAFVAYDAADKTKVTLAGAGGTTISNVKAAVADTDAVNLKQLKDTGLVDGGGNVQKAVLFNADGTEANGNAEGKKLANLAAGSRDADAVNLKQLKDAGLAVDGSGNVTNGFVSYDAADKTKVTLAGNGGTTISNVKAGVADQDAVNVKQLKDTGLVDGGGNVQKAVLFNADGTEANANADGKKLANLAAGSRDADAVNLKQLKDAGLTVDNGGNVTNSFVSYDAADKAKITLAGAGGTTISNVKAAVADTDAVNLKQLKDTGLVDGGGNVQKAVLFNADGTEANANAEGKKLANLAAGSRDADAVNLKQLKDAGLTVDNGGNVTNSFVSYDAADKAKITLAGAGGTTISNVKAGVADQDAVNVKQLKDTGLVDNGGNVQKAVLFNADGTDANANADGKKLANLAAGSRDADAVNLKQLKDAGLTVDGSGNVTNSFVSYDAADKGKVTLAGTGGTTISNVKAGVADQDAVNVKQLKDSGIVDNGGNVQKAVLFNADGTEANANADGKKLANLAAGSRDADAVNLKQLKDAGLTVDNGGNVTNSFVSYDAADKGKITLAGAGGTTISNVKAAVADTDAVNLKQLKDTGLVDNGGNVQKAVLFNADGTAANANADGKKLANLAAGNRDTDAVNLKQLKDAGLAVDGNGTVTNSFVAYDDASKDRVTLAGPAGTTLSNVKAGVASTDAVNVGQLQGAGLIDDNGNVRKAVLFDGPAGEANVAGQRIVNVKAGTADTDAANIKQLKDAGLQVDPTTGNVTNGFVAYDTADKGKVTLRGTGGTTVANVKAATANDHAVNLAQLKDAGIAVDSTGKVTNAAVIYDNASKQVVTFGGGTDGTTLRNVRAGVANTDAANVSQLRGLAETLGGGAGVGADGAITRPTYTLSGNPYNNVGDALDDLDRRTNANTVDIDDLKAGRGIRYFRANSSAEDALATGTNSVAVGPLAQASAENALAMGTNALAEAADATAVGFSAEASAASATALGAKALATQAQSVAVGSAASAGASRSVAVGADAVSSVDNATSVGANATANANGALALGAAARGAHANAVALGAGSTTDRADSVAVGNPTKSRQITFVGAGTADTDAVNVKQLKAAGVNVDGNGNVTNSFVSYDAADKAKVTLGGTSGTTISNVKAGVADLDAVNVKQLKDSGIVDEGGNVQKAVLFNADGTDANANADGKKLANLAAGSRDTDAVNLKQLKDAGLTVDNGGNVTNSFVSYDAADKGKITLTGAGGTTISNVKAAVADTDAVNLKQLKDTGLVDNGGNVQKAVLFNADGTDANANADGKKLANLAAGSRDADAVNLKQLKDAGLTVDNGGNVTNSFVSYDAADKGKITLAGTGGTTISNVKAGVADQDAVNVKQLKDSGIVDEGGNVQKAVLFNADGTAANANADGKKLANLAAGSRDTDAVNLKQLKDAGLTVDNGGNVTNSFVSYDAADKAKITLAGTGGTTISNVKAGVADQDAVNVKQLKDSGIVDNGGNVQKAVLFNADGTEANANADGKKLANLAAGSRDADAVNLKQLKDAGLTVDNGGTVTNSFVAYDAADKAQVTLGGVGGTTVTNVKAGSAALDAVNVTQLKGITSSLGGGSDVNADGTIKRPVYRINNTTYDNVGDALAAAAGSGSTTDPLALHYTDATKTRVALEGQGGSTLTNVKAGQADLDAVNVKQLKDAGLVDEGGNVQKAVLFDGPNGDANAAGKKVVSVAAGTADNDAINLKQLKDAGFIFNNIGIITNKGITYTPGTIEAGAPRVDLEPGVGNSRYFGDTDGDGVTELDAPLPKGTRITNVADGIEDTDAANLGMVREISQNTLEGNNNALRLMAFSDSAPPVARMQVVPMAAVETAAVTPSEGSGAESADRGRYKILENGNWYLQVAGRVDGVGRTGPTDSAFTGNNAGVIAIGSDSGTTAENAIAFGTLSRATARDAVAIGTGSVADQENTVSVGSATDHSYEALAPDRASRVTLTTKANARRVVNMAAGQAETDAVNVGQLSQVTATLGGGAAVQQDGSVKGPTYSVGGNTYTNVGDALAAVNAAAATGSPLGIVYDDATRTKVSFQGQGGTTLSNVKAGTADTDAVNVSQLKASGLVDGSGNAATAVVYDDASRSSVTLGGKDATSPVRLGNVADAQADTDAVNLKQLRSAGLVDGDGATLDAVVYDGDSSKGRVTFGGANGTVLNNVADGRIATGSREAVNGGQIAALRDSLNSSISGLDTRVTTLEKTPPISGDGALNPLVNVQGPGSDANAGPAVEGSVAVGADTRAQTSGSVAIGKGAQVTADAANSVALGQGSVADRSNSVSVGAPGSERVMANVADGVRDTDVATVRQMNQAQTSAKEYTDTRINDAWNTITRDMDDMNRQVNRGIAASAALINVTPYLPGRTALNAGVSSYRGEAALGVGLSRWSDNGRVNFNAGISAAKDDEPIYRVGMGIVF